jgi:hypothetical protein
MAGVYKSANRKMMALLEKDCQEICTETANDWRGLADEMVPQIANARFATDALRFSATVATDKKSDYPRAIAKALRARQAAIDAGEPWAAPLEVLPEIKPVKTPGVAMAILYYPVGHAVEVHEGLGQAIGARPFLVQTRPGNIFAARIEMLAKKMEKISV